MKVRIINTTDGKYIGLVFDTEKALTAPDGITFHPTKVQTLGEGMYRYSNSNYVAEVKEVIE